MIPRPDTETLRVARSGLADAFRTTDYPGGIIVHEKRRFIYMKISKTAGTSILRRTLEPLLGGFVFKKDHPEAFERWREQITDRALADYYIFAVVRDPWDRIQSIARFHQMPIQKLMDEFDTLPPEALHPEHKVPLHQFTHLNGHQFVDRVCRFENLQADMKQVFSDLGLNVGKLPHSNRSRRLKLVEHMTKAQVDWVAERYARDIELYKYSPPRAGVHGILDRLLQLRRPMKETG